ncbi:MAG: FAD-binding oxidoreductase [Candidatus Tectomicrobia bacterium]|uniref:FAD-binding oxidoreductase n=1 Tax=Tectimicrobiota bacterium TaxID=2528274 RepID=A0A932M1W4_UNCTE|nr:FAD-binding oxidoreductase [Candidatus Tectomicrobia bacterium]
MSIQTADILIIGGGIIGASLAYQLALRKPSDLKVVLLEKRGLAEGTTGKSVATIDHQQSTPLDIELRQQSRTIYLELAGEFPAQIGYKPIGFLHTVTTPRAKEILERDIALQERMGVPVEFLNPEELHEILPILRTREILAAGFCPKDGYLDPYGATHLFAHQAQKRGVEIRTDTPVTEFLVDSERVCGVRTSAGEFQAAIVVNTAGPWAQTIFQRAGLRLPLKLVRGEILALKPEILLPHTLPMTLNRETTFYFREETGGIVLLGRLDTDYNAPRPQVDPDDYYGWEQRPGDQHRSFVFRMLQSHLPALLDAPVHKGWVGLRTVTPDAHPILGPTPLAGLLCAVGFSGTGIQIGPACSAYLAEYILSGEKTEVLKTFGLDRFFREQAQD